ncbi:MAG TPA: MiaB/RimO family radical SAM methylthiotransferase [Gemmatimonadaceae bacterium]|nr:MiaB/RimO family radical SAM methylthiotransferase [Gemmatimonadaceae bacterium]
MKVFLQTYGCRANHADSEAVRGMLLATGAELVRDSTQADAAVFNSCAVTREAEADLRQGVRRAARSNPRLVTIVMGCAAALDDGRIASLPTVRRVLAGAPIPDIARALGLDPARAAGAPVRQSGARALLRLQDGCDEHCTFCATTLARGAQRSRPAAAVVEEARILAEWHPEIVLTGVHIGSYGREHGCSLGALVTQLVRAVPGVRFRLSSIEATEVDAPLRELLTDPSSGVVPFLHAPLQSGADGVLRRMGRHWYTAASYARAIERIVRDAPVFGLGADVMAGFPGESDDDHAATLALVDALPFTTLHVFPYSEREGTAAPRLGHRVASTIIARRATELRELSRLKGAAYRARRAGGRADVIVIDGMGTAARRGLTEDGLSVRVSHPDCERGGRFHAHLDDVSGVLFARPAAG